MYCIIVSLARAGTDMYIFLNAELSPECSFISTWTPNFQIIPPAATLAADTSGDESEDLRKAFHKRI